MHVTEGKYEVMTLAVKATSLLVILCPLFFVPPVHGEEDELLSLELYNGSQSETVSVGRSPRPASQTAENITVVTAREIEALNAHTLPEVLNLVAGVQFEFIRTPGSVTNFSLQGSNFNHILVLIDNVPINNLTDNYPDVGTIPVQMIERIEIVKGAASSSWGNALGGVINIITKVPQTDRPFGGLASASIGSASTVDGRGEASGTADRFGYYLTGGKLRSDGLLPNNMVDLNHFYGKLHYELPRQGSITATTFVNDNSQGQLQGHMTPTMVVNVNSDSTQVLGTLSAYYPLSDRFSIEGMYRTRHRDSDIIYALASDGSTLRDLKDNEASNGAVLKVSYLDDLQRLVAGVDYDHLKVDFRATPGSESKRSDDRVGVYLNDTLTLGRFAVTPSVRFDRTDTSGDQFSPSFGVTYALTDNSVLRGYTAKGYSITSLVLSDSLEKVWTSQVGFESADIPYVWLKGTLFRNETGDIASATPGGPRQKQLKQGVEVEARTLPVFDTSFSVGYTFVDATDRDTDAVVKGIARHTLNLGLKYEDSRHLRMLLTGHYIDWNQDPAAGGKYQHIVWDLHLAKRLTYTDTLSVEFFASIRNLTNQAQYSSTLYMNPGLWGEMGMRCAF